MSWFGRGRGSTENVMTEKTDLPSYEEPPSFGGAAPSEFRGPASSVGGSSAPSQEALQMAVLQEQQKALVQQVISKLTEISFEQCVDRPEASLSARQRNCVHNVVGKYLDTSEFVIGRTTKQMQQHQ